MALDNLPEHTLKALLHIIHQYQLDVVSDKEWPADLDQATSKMEARIEVLNHHVMMHLMELPRFYQIKRAAIQAGATSLRFLVNTPAPPQEEPIQSPKSTQS